MYYYVKGAFADTPVPSQLRVREGYMKIEDGCCAGFSEIIPVEDTAEVLDYSGKLIIPGMSDLHLHASQYAYCGTGMDLELLQWLYSYAYPEEARFAEHEHAEDAYSIFVRDINRTATTRACIFATQHTEATIELMRQLERAGLKCYVGRLNMNRNCPDYYREESAEAGLAETERWLDLCEAENFKNSMPMITPRFTPSVTDDYMKGLGEIAARRKVPMQSHLSENTDEIEWVKELCPDTEYYYESYSRYGLFGGDCPTVMAHCIYSGEEECRAMKENGVFIAHCPSSNENVIAGIAPAAMYLREGYNVGLGSDVSGGHSLNLFDSMVDAVQCSKLRWKFIDDSYKPLSLVEAFYLATAGGGAFFGKVGMFEPGYEFDAVVIDDSALKNTMNFTWAERIERIAYMGRTVPEAKFVSGKKIV